jgi:hypothetical protein
MLRSRFVAVALVSVLAGQCAAVAVPIVAGAATPTSIASGLTPMPPVPLPAAGASPPSTSAQPTGTDGGMTTVARTGTTTAPGRLPRTGMNVLLEVIVAAALVGIGAGLRLRRPA